MGGGIGGIVGAVTNPIGSVANNLLGSNNDIAKGINGLTGIGGLTSPLGIYGSALTGGIGKDLFGGALFGDIGGKGGGGPGINWAGQPTMAPFQSQLNPDGSIKDVYKTQDTYNPQAINAIRQDALRTPGTLSKWGQAAQSNAANQIAQQQAGQLATAQNRLAMQGGLRTGARERLAASGMQNGLAAKQNAYNQIAMQDESNRQNQLNNLVGQELGLANYQTGVQNTNIGRATTDIGQQRLYDIDKYNEAMRAWAAANTAAAMPQTQDRGFLGNLLGGLF